MMMDAFELPVVADTSKVSLVPDERGHVLVAFSVFGLNGPVDPSPEESKRGSFERPGLKESFSSARRGWLSSLNTGVGDKQDIFLMLTLSTIQEQVVGKTSGIPLSASPLRSGDLLSPLTPSRSSVLYQSEQRAWEQPGTGFPFPMMASSPAVGDAGMGSAPGGHHSRTGSDGRRHTSWLGGEGIVHFSVPAKVPACHAPVVSTARVVPGADGEEATFTAELWQVVNRVRRVSVGSVQLAREEMLSMTSDPHQWGIRKSLQSERFPAASLAIWRLPVDIPPRPLSLGPSGVANPVVGRFNPVTSYFTSLRRKTSPASAFDAQPYLGRDTAGSAPGAVLGTMRDTALELENFLGASAAVSTRGPGGLPPAPPPPPPEPSQQREKPASSSEVELVVCQELAVETKLAYKLPLQFLFPIHNALLKAVLAWQLRAQQERIRQGVFGTEQEAFSNGRVLVRVSIPRARGLAAIAAATAASTGPGAGPGAGGVALSREDEVGAEPFTPLSAAQPAGGSMAASSQYSGPGGATFNPAAAGPSPTFGGEPPAASPGGGGIDGTNKVSASMRRLGGGVRRIGFKAVAMAKIATQASTAHLRLGVGSTQDKMLRQANFFVRVTYLPPGSDTIFSSPDPHGADEAASSYGLPGPGGADPGAVSGVRAERMIGLTNTEYGTTEPCWGTNANRHACPYKEPRLDHQVSVPASMWLDAPSNAHETSRGFQTEVGVLPQTMRREVTPSEADLAFNFYVPKEDLKGPGPSSFWRGSDGSTAGGDGDRGRIRLDLYQNTFTLTSGIVDVPVGSITVPVPAVDANGGGDADQFRDTLNAPEWRYVERYKPTSGAFGPESEFVDDQSMAGGALGVLGFEDDPQMASSRDPPQILVGVSVKEKSAAGSVSNRRRSLSSEAMPKASSTSPSLYDGLFGKVQRVEPTGDGQSKAGSASGATGSLGEWTEVEDSESDDESLGGASASGAPATAVPPQGAVSDISARISAGFASVSLASSHSPEASGIGASRQTSLLDCYKWVDLIGNGDSGSGLDTETLVAFFRQVEYPVEWIERHARAIGEQWDWLAKVLDVYQQRLAEGDNFRSSLLKKDPVSQYVATNLHIQVWSIRDPSTGKDVSYDFVTTGAPAAHALGHANGGLASLQARLRETGEKVLRCRARCRESCENGGVQKLQEMEGNLERLREALLNYEVATCAVSVRKACVLSQAISIAAASFCAKLEMMARGTLHVPSDLTRGGCRGTDELARRWTTAGFLLGFEGLLSIQGKELGMVEDTVAAMEMLADFQLEVLPATPDQPLPKGSSGRSGAHDVEEDSFVMVDPRDEFELEVGVSGKTIQCLVGGASLAKLPRVLWDKKMGGSVKIIPVFFTQGIDIQQSMSHASSLWKEKSAFQADINGQNLAKLNHYCHEVCAHDEGDEGGIHAAQHPFGPSEISTGGLRSTGTPGVGGSGIGRGGRGSKPFGSFMSSSGGSFSLSAVMPGLPRTSSRQAPSSATSQPGQDLLDLGDFAPPTPGDISGSYSRNTFSASSRGSRKASFGSRTPGSAVETPSPSARPGSAPLGRMHPALLELEAAVRDDKINHKNTAILLEAQLAVRRLCGGRVTFCKSGKDRTAMSVTLEEALLLAAADEEALSCAGADGRVGAARGGGWRASERNGVLDDANVLRAHGCRLMVAEKNVGRPLYSFNALQRQFIPELYQPPTQTIQDVITSALNRDS